MTPATRLARFAEVVFVVLSARISELTYSSTEPHVHMPRAIGKPVSGLAKAAHAHTASRPSMTSPSTPPASPTPQMGCLLLMCDGRRV